MKKVWIDAGHGGSDCGATSEGIKEADINLNVARLVFSYLASVGYEVGMTRVDDGGSGKIYNSRRCALANEMNVDIFVSIHCNSAAKDQANGMEVIYCPGSVKGKELAHDVMNSMVLEFPDLRERGVKTDKEIGRGFKFTVLHSTRMPAVIVEMAFLSNAKERIILTSVEGQSKFAQAIAKGIVDYFENDD